MKENAIYIKTGNIIEDARQIIERARSNAVRSVDFCRVQMYWNLGKRILEEEQDGKERADYGAYIVRKLAKNLEVEYGSGFGVRQIERARQFYRLYPIASAVRTQLNWMQYKLLIAISDSDKREFYELESVNNCWTGRETERQINSQLYERLLLSNDSAAGQQNHSSKRISDLSADIGTVGERSKRGKTDRRRYEKTIMKKWRHCRNNF